MDKQLVKAITEVENKCPYTPEKTLNSINILGMQMKTTVRHIRTPSQPKNENRRWGCGLMANLYFSGGRIKGVTTSETILAFSTL